MGLNRTEKQVLLYGGVGLLAYGTVINPLFQYLGIKDTPEEQQREDDTNRDNLPSPGDGSNTPNVSDAELRSVKQAQLNAMDGLGTNTQRLKSSLKKLNGAALQKLFALFGTKYYNTATGSWGTYTQYQIGLAQEYNLFQWYQSELGAAEKKALNKIWQKAGMQIS